MRFPYNFGGEAVAAVPFTYAGTMFKQGAPIPYRELKIIDSDLANLWRATKIDFTGKPYPASAPPAAGGSVTTSPPVPVKAAPAQAQAQRR
jgi:hypothetical protein